MENFLLMLLYICAGAIIGVKVGWYWTERISNDYLTACAQGGMPAVINGLMYVVVPEQKFHDMRNLANDSLNILRKAHDRVALVQQFDDATIADLKPTEEHA